MIILNIDFIIMQLKQKINKFDGNLSPFMVNDNNNFFNSTFASNIRRLQLLFRAIIRSKKKIFV